MEVVKNKKFRNIGERRATPVRSYNRPPLYTFDERILFFIDDSPPQLFFGPLVGTISCCVLTIFTVIYLQAHQNLSPLLRHSAHCFVKKYSFGKSIKVFVIHFENSPSIFLCANSKNSLHLNDDFMLFLVLPNRRLATGELGRAYENFDNH